MKHIKEVMQSMPELAAYVAEVTSRTEPMSDQERAETLHYLSQPREPMQRELPIEASKNGR